MRIEKFVATTGNGWWELGDVITGYVDAAIVLNPNEVKSISLGRGRIQKELRDIVRRVENEHRYITNDISIRESYMITRIKSLLGSHLGTEEMVDTSITIQLSEGTLFPFKREGVDGEKPFPLGLDDSITDSAEVLLGEHGNYEILSGQRIEYMGLIPLTEDNKSKIHDYQILYQEAKNYLVSARFRYAKKQIV